MDLLHFQQVLLGGIQLSDLPDPCSVCKAMASPDSDNWKIAMDNKMLNLKSHDVYNLVPCQPGMHMLCLGWVLHCKFQNGVFNKNKACLVARGNHQHPGINYRESFSPVMCLESL